MSEAKPHERLRNPLDELTERERQILQKLAAGLNNKEIGQQLHLAEKTIRHYMTNILQKLQVRNRVEAALIAQKEMLSDQKNFKQPS
jgi:RNA polymerase sigma factor (sigma-70 family)